MCFCSYKLENKETESLNYTQIMPMIRGYEPRYKNL